MFMRKLLKTYRQLTGPTGKPVELETATRHQLQTHFVVEPSMPESEPTVPGTRIDIAQDNWPHLSTRSRRDDGPGIGV